MTPERWQQVELLCNAALERESSQREAFLAQACRGDDELRREVESLLAQEKTAEGFLESLGDEAATKPWAKMQGGSGGQSIIGRQLGSYKVVSLLGVGGMGEFYRAHDTKLKRDVAIKVLPRAFARDPERLARFGREARLLAALNHPNIASIYGLEDSDETHALVMELVEGPTLADRIRQGPIPTEEALPIAKQICEALEYAHERGIVHRDLKPANIKVSRGDSVKILDFGLAKAIQGRGEEDLANSPTISQMATEAGVLLGTAAYMSPEQAKAKAVDRRADIWAFGCVLYEMLTGKKAFEGETVTDTLAAVIRADPDWSQLPAITPSHIRLLLRRCLQKDSKQRLQAIGDARISLEEVITGVSEATPSSHIPAPLWRRCIPWAFSGVAAAALATFGWLHEAQVRTVVPADPVRFEIPLPVKPPLRPSGLFALSPDGRQLAFVATSSDGTRHIWIRAMNSLEIRPVPGTEFVGTVLFWSPDSRFMAFDSGGKLLKIDISGGPAETVCAVNGTPVGGSWSKDGIMIFGMFDGPLMQVSASGGVATPLTVLDTAHGDLAHTSPQFLPDGTHFLYLRDIGNSGFLSEGSLNVKPADQDSKRLAETLFGAAYAQSSGPDFGKLLFLRDGTLMAQPFDVRHLSFSGEPVPIAKEHLGAFLDSGLFSVSANDTVVYLPSEIGQSQPTWLDAQGKVLGTVGELGPYSDLALSPDGKRAIVARYTLPEQRSGLWLLDLSQGTNQRFEVDSDAENQRAIWSPDGRSIIFSSLQIGQWNIYEKSASGANEKNLLLKSSEVGGRLSWAPDGNYLLYNTVAAKTKSDLWVLPLGDHQKPVPFLQTEFNERDAHFSPEGHWVAYVSDESGRNEVYVRAFSPGASGEAGFDSSRKFQISSGGGSAPQWRQGGKELYYIDLSGKLMAVQVTTMGNIFQASAPKFLFQAPGSSWSPAPDGKRFLFLVPEVQEAVPFTVVLNWQAALKK